MLKDEMTISFYPAFVDSSVYISMAHHMGLKCKSECDAEVIVHGMPGTINQYEKEMQRHEKLARVNYVHNVD